MDRLPAHSLLRHRRSTCVPAAVAAVALACAVSAQAQISFPYPGGMRVKGLPSQVPAGRTLNLRELMPMAIFGGELRLQRRSASVAWQTLASGPPRPHVAWLHWSVPASWGGSQITVRLLLESGGRMLAVSPAYTIAVTGPAKARSH